MVSYDYNQHEQVMEIFGANREVYRMVFKIVKLVLAGVGVFAGINFIRSQEWIGLGMCAFVIVLIGGIFYSAQRKYEKLLIALEHRDYTVERSRCERISIKSNNDNGYRTIVNIVGYEKAIELDPWHETGWKGIKEGDEVDVIEAAGQQFVIKAL